MQFMSQKEFLDQYKNGKKIFEDVVLQFMDVPKFEISDVIIRNSKILFCTFYDSKMNNVKWENCTFYYVSFYAGSAANLIFDRCDMEQFVADNFAFEKTAFLRCNIRWSGILNSNFRNVDMSTSMQYKFFTDIEQVTQQDIEEAIHLITRDIERMDVSTRMKIKQIIRQDAEKYDLRLPEEKKGSAYAVQNKDNIDAPLTYGEVRSMVETAFGVYGTSPAYKTKRTAYETQDTYRK